MSIGTWLLTGFLLTVVYAFLWLPDRLRNWSATRGAARLALPSAGSRWTRAWWSGRRLVAPLVIPLSLGVGIYTGILLGAVPARPFWNTPMTAQLFLFSAMSTGAATPDGVRLCCRAGSPRRSPRASAVSSSLDVVLILLEIFMIIPFILHHA